ncbi:MAG: hypothetical protein WA869_22110 [Alloacidobacterium sp.]
MRSIRTLLHQRPTATLLTLAVVFAGWQCPARAQEFMPNTAQKTQQTPTGRIVWHHVGRVFLNPNTFQFVYVGYLVGIDPIDGSLFNGLPGESTAYFTFSTDLAQLTPLPNNNDVGLDLVSAGTFSVYYNATPGADWSDPASFSRGKRIATFHRNESVFQQLGTVSLHSLSETLMWSSNFVFGGQLYNFNRIAPNGITFAQFFSGTAQATADYPVTFSGAGTVFAVGTPDQPR